MKRFIADKPPEIEKQRDHSEENVPVAMTLKMFSYDDTEEIISSHYGSISSISPEFFSLSRIPQSAENEKYASSRQKEMDG